MEFRKLGKSSLNVSFIGFGTWGISGDLGNVNRQKTVRVIKEAYDSGINFFDTAPAYGYESHGMKGYGISEKILGKALKKFRDKVLIATKFGIVYGEGLFNNSKEDNSKEVILKEIEGSLRRLQTDYIDLYQVHMPDPCTSIEETFSTLNDLKESGKIRYIGVCNYSIGMIEEAMEFSKIISTQNLYNMIQRNATESGCNKLLYRTEDEILPFCEKKKLGFIPYSPFCQGLLTGDKLNVEDYNFDDFRKRNDELKGEKLVRNLKLVKELLKISQSINKPLPQMVLNWLREDKRITTVIAGPTEKSQVKDNIASIGWQLDNTVYMQINDLLDKYINNNWKGK